MSQFDFLRNLIGESWLEVNVYQVPVEKLQKKEKSPKQLFKWPEKRNKRDTKKSSKKEKKEKRIRKKHWKETKEDKEKCKETTGKSYVYNIIRQRMDKFI